MCWERAKGKWSLGRSAFQPACIPGRWLEPEGGHSGSGTEDTWRLRKEGSFSVAQVLSQIKGNSDTAVLVPSSARAADDVVR